MLAGYIVEKESEAQKKEEGKAEGKQEHDEGGT